MICPDDPSLIAIRKIFVAQDADIRAFREFIFLQIGIADSTGAESEKLVPDQIENRAIQILPVPQRIEFFRIDPEKMTASIPSAPIWS